MTSRVGTIARIRKDWLPICPGKTCHESPPSTDLSTPAAGESPPPFEKLPVPAYTTMGSSGLYARSKMDNVGAKSVRGDQLGFDDVAFVVFQIPPCTAPTSMMSAFVG